MTTALATTEYQDTVDLAGCEAGDGGTNWLAVAGWTALGVAGAIGGYLIGEHYGREDGYAIGLEDGKKYRDDVAHETARRFGIAV